MIFLVICQIVIPITILKINFVANVDKNYLKFQVIFQNVNYHLILMKNFAQIVEKINQ